MFLTIGFIVGFIAGWWVNEKVENLGQKVNPLNWFPNSANLSLSSIAIREIIGRLIYN